MVPFDKLDLVLESLYGLDKCHAGKIDHRMGSAEHHARTVDLRPWEHLMKVFP